MNTWLRISLRLVLFATAQIRGGFSYSHTLKSITTASWRRGGQQLFAGLNDCRGANVDETEGFSLERRSFLLGSNLLFFLLGSCPIANAALVENETDSDGRLTDAIVQSLVFEKILGSGSYKTVYLVSAELPNTDKESTTTASTKIYRYAMAVERLTTNRDVKNAFRGVTIPQTIQHGVQDNEKELFETIVDWWVQSSNVQDFVEGERVFPLSKSATRSRSKPKKSFTGSRWMVSLKPVYETDLKRFVRNSPAVFPVGSVKIEETYWTEETLLAFVLETLHAGKLMHQAGVVHRDIKPKNMMIYNVTSSSGSFAKKPVIIDYGFAEFGDPLVLQKGRVGAKTAEKKVDLCVERPGQLKGEVDYVIAEDLANYRGCQRGDAYAMGKTLYEFIFGSLELQENPKDEEEVISIEGTEVRNQKFRDLLYNNPNAGTESRFSLSKDAAECLLYIIKGLCGNPRDSNNALSFAEAESILSSSLDSLGSRR